MDDGTQEFEFDNTADEMVEDQGNMESEEEISDEGAEEVVEGEEGSEDSAEEEEEEISDEDAEGEEGDEEDGDEEGDEPAFKPNVKFKVNQKDMEIPKEFHALMKNPESEKMVRDLFEKAHGLDVVKERFNQVRTERDTIRNEHTQISNYVNGAHEIYQRAVQTRDPHKLDEFFEKLQIPQEVIFQYALAKAELNEMDPAQRQIVEGQIRANRAAEAAQRNVQMSDERFQAQEAQIKQMQFEQSLARPDIAAIAADFDAKAGKAGAFRNAVATLGELTWHRTGGKVNLTPEQAINMIVQQNGLKANPQTPGMKPGAQSAGGASKKKVIQRTSTIPNVKGRSTSPLKGSKPRSIEDLKKLAKEAAEKG